MDIPSHLLQACFEHGAACYPDEACGVLSGPAGADGVAAFHPIENQLNRMHERDPERFPRTARQGYYLDPLAYMKLEKALAADGHRVKVLFHTHPDVGAYFSEEDRKRALWDDRPLHPGMVYLVCGIRDGRPDGAVLATWDEKKGDFEVREIG